MTAANKSANWLVGGEEGGGSRRREEKEGT
jgi:hypothetical protein